MSLIEKEYLYRIRIVYNADGELELVETIDRATVFKNGEALPGHTESVTVYPARLLGPAAEAFLKAMHDAKSQDDAEKAKDAEPAQAEG